MGAANKAWQRAKRIKKRPSDPTVLAGEFELTYSDGSTRKVTASNARNARRIAIKQAASKMKVWK